MKHNNFLFHQLFEVQANLYPDRTALTFGDEHITYQELNSKANQLANRFLQDGIGPSAIVGVCVERSLELVISLLGVLKMGGIYLPLDPNLPEERLFLMLKDSLPAILITNSKLTHRFQHLLPTFEIDLEAYDFFLNVDLNLPIASNQPAYLIYTSGSTGKPKGVLIQHLSVVNFLNAMLSQLEIGQDENFLSITTISFDIALLEIFLPLSSGNRSNLIPRNIASDGEELLQQIHLKEINFIQATPSTWELLLNSGWQGDQRLKIVSGGEKLSEKLAHDLQRKARKFWNVYGPTETTIWSTCGVVHPDTLITIGRPIHNTQTFILNEYLERLPLGGWGELFISGDGVAAGYLNRPGLTAESFLPNPYSKTPGCRFYKTGDLAKYLSDGQIECGGRKDHQIKYLGYRIEPGEIESVILENSQVQQSIVTLYDQKGDKSLVAYIVSKETLNEDFEKALRKHLEIKLPSYMVPRHLVLLDRLPLNHNGKVDRQALPNPTLIVRNNTERGTQKNSLEESLLAIWSNLLQIKNLGVEDNFFKIGGHSLMATQVVFAIRQKFGVHLPLRDIFNFPTVQKLARQLQRQVNSSLDIKRNPKITQRQQKENIPLSFSQQRLWFIEQMLGGMGLYNIPTAFLLKGNLDYSYLEQALKQLLLRHDALRLSINSKEGVVTQRVSEDVTLPLIFEDFSDKDRQDEIINNYLKTEIQRPFDLSHPPLIRLSIIKLSEQKYLFTLIMHHIISDAESVEIFFRELALLYNGLLLNQPKSIPPLDIQYTSFVIWQHEKLQGETLDKQLTYWVNKLKNIPELIQLPWDFRRPLLLTYQGAIHYFNLSKTLVKKLRELCEMYQASLFMVLLSAFKILLHKYSGQNDIVVGTAISNRQYAENNSLIGFLVNTIAIRTRWQERIDFKTLLNQVRENVLEAHENLDVPFEQLVDNLKLRRDMSRHPIFQVMFMLESQDSSAFVLEGIDSQPINIKPQRSKFDLTLWAREEQEGMLLGFEYSTDLFAKGTISLMASHLEALIQAITQRPHSPISQLFMITEKEQLFINRWNETKKEFSPLFIHQLIEKQAEQTPDKIALIFEDHLMSYSELNRQSNLLSNYLSEIGVGPEVMVGICLDRSFEAIIALIAILKSGGCYIPIDPTFPEKRLHYILEDTKLQMLFTNSYLMSHFKDYKGKIIQIDRDWKAIQNKTSTSLNLSLHHQSRAFVIYTSGSTGLPKGVEGLHQGILNRMNWMISMFPFVEGEVFIHKTSLNIVDSFFEIFDPLAVGAAVSICSIDRTRDLHLMIEDMEKYRVSRIIFVPTLLQSILEDCLDIFGNLKTLKTVLIGGEAVTSQLANRFFQLFPEVHLINLFGATETTAEVSYYDVPKITENVPIGKPIANTQIYLLSEHLLLAPFGIVGEIYIGGDSLTKGYLNQPGLTASRFVPHPFSSDPGRRLYRIGDLGKLSSSGYLEYLGREDFQINIRGFRVEPSEIETTLCRHAAVLNSLVIAKEGTLIAYIQCRGDQDKKGEKSLIQELRAYLMTRFPQYMVPDRFIFVNQFKYTSSNKINRKDLPAPIVDLDQDNYAHPRNEIEFHLAKIWENLLQIKGIGVFTNFFEIGGHSLLVMRLLAQIRKRFDRSLSVTEVFRNPTIALLSKCLGSKVNSQNSLIEIQANGNKEPLYLVHPAMGVAFPYNLLSAHIQDRAIYGINNPLYGRKDIRYSSIEEMAAAYIKMLPNLETPYILGGWSFGGMVAFEMAQQLSVLNRAPRLLILIDSFNSAKFGREGLNESPNDMEEFLMRQGIAPLSEEYEDAKREIENNVSLAMTYYAKSYSGEVILLKAMIPEEYNLKAFADPTNGWAEVLSVPIKVYHTFCRHGEMFDQPFVPIVAKELLSACLQVQESIHF